MNCWLGMKGWAVSEGKRLVPNLRFPEFRETDEWTSKKLKDACEVNPTNSVLPDKFVYIDLESVEAGKLTARKTINSDEAPSRAQRLLQFGDVIFQVVRPYQRNNFHFKTNDSLEYVASTGYAQLRAKDSADFLFQAVHVDGFVDRVIAKCTGSSYPAINSSDLAEVPLAIPRLEEQKKIADCLSSVDELIAAQARKVDALKTHKQGLMQQLFPREGETQPRLRFPEFEATADWEVKKLEDLAKRGSGHTPSKNNPEYYGGGIKWISLADSKRLDAGLISETQTEISAQGIKKSSAVLHAAGTVLISRDAGVGKSAVMAAPMAVSQHFIVWTCHAHLLSNWFLYYLLQEMKPMFERIATGSTIETIGLPFFKELRIALPALPEQQGVANCLISIDDNITAATQEREALKTHKKGLMQQIFPSPDAIEA